MKKAEKKQRKKEKNGSRRATSTTAWTTAPTIAAAVRRHHRRHRPSQRHGTATGLHPDAGPGRHPSRTKTRTKNGGMLPPVVVPLALANASWVGVVARGDIRGRWAAAASSSADPPTTSGLSRTSPAGVVGCRSSSSGVVGVGGVGRGGDWGWASSVVGGRGSRRETHPGLGHPISPLPIQRDVEVGVGAAIVGPCHPARRQLHGTSASFGVGVCVASSPSSVVRVRVLVLAHIVGGRRRLRPSWIVGGWSARGQRRTTDTPTFVHSAVRSTNTVM